MWMNWLERTLRPREAPPRPAADESPREAAQTAAPREERRAELPCDADAA